ncbi:MAG: hypothetical protein U9O82_11140 [Thermodesulfobacteriota bacterium]|nr:hypothetical protein [Thermodesulfobacteriota bacterium]
MTTKDELLYKIPAAVCGFSDEQSVVPILEPKNSSSLGCQMRLFGR